MGAKAPYYKLNIRQNETIKISTAIKIHHLGWQ